MRRPRLHYLEPRHPSQRHRPYVYKHGEKWWACLGDYSGGEHRAYAKWENAVSTALVWAQRGGSPQVRIVTVERKQPYVVVRGSLRPDSTDEPDESSPAPRKPFRGSVSASTLGLAPAPIEDPESVSAAFLRPLDLPSSRSADIEAVPEEEEP